MSAIDFNKICTAVFGVFTAETNDDLSAQYPDLEPADLVLTRDYFTAYYQKTAQPVLYQQARGKVLARMRQLQMSLEFVAPDRAEQIRTISRLIDFNQIMRRTGVAPVYYAGDNRIIKPADLQQCGGDSLAADIPEEVKLMLDDESAAYVARHVQRAFFTTRLKDQVRILDADKWAGTSEGATRSVIIDTFNEKNGENYEPWLLAAALVHEAAHIDWFHRSGREPAILMLEKSERHAYIVEARYLSGLFIRVKDDAVVDPAAKDRIAFAFTQVMDRIKSINRRFGFELEDLSLGK